MAEEKNKDLFGNLVQKAFYLGVGAANLAAEKANTALQDLRLQGQKIAEEMVERGEMSTEEAKAFVDNLIQRAQNQTQVSVNPKEPPKEPRRIEILDDEEEPTPPPTASTPDPAADLDGLRAQVERLKNELKNLQDQDHQP